jgi:glucose-6-phosphate isomerase
MKKEASTPNPLSITISPANLKTNLQAAKRSLITHSVVDGLFKTKNASLWGNAPERVKVVSNRLGWIDLPETFKGPAKECMHFANKLKAEGYKYAVLLGMGGSSLSPEVARQVFGTAKGYLKLIILDNTAPEAVQQVEKQIEPEKTLFIVASKSGTTTEPNCFYEYFYSQLKAKKGASAGRNFVAITDKGTPLEKAAGKLKFRKVFSNPGDIGGRYSVLSYFGLLPMALSGIDVLQLLDKATEVKQQCLQNKDNDPTIAIGLLLGLAQKQGRDKVTFVLSPSIQSFGYWAEQLIAESTGKEGNGLIPVHGEELRKPGDYNDDRVFVAITMAGEKSPGTTRKLKALEAAGNPLITIELNTPMDIGGEFYRWQVITAIAGWQMGINPFDEPNVAESKNNTKRLLNEWKDKMPELPKPLFSQTGIAVYESKAITNFSKTPLVSLQNLFAALHKMVPANGYVALLPYFAQTKQRDVLLHKLRTQLQVHLKTTTTLLYGPRYLHSTGQLHKGGPANGFYIMLTANDNKHLAIPGESFDFNMLHTAQALGDYIALDDKGRKVLRIHLGKNINKALVSLCALAIKAL